MKYNICRVLRSLNERIAETGSRICFLRYKLISKQWVMKMICFVCVNKVLPASTWIKRLQESDYSVTSTALLYPPLSRRART